MIHKRHECTKGEVLLQVSEKLILVLIFGSAWGGKPTWIVVNASTRPGDLHNISLQGNFWINYELDYNITLCIQLSYNSATQQYIRNIGANDGSHFYKQDAV